MTVASDDVTPARRGARVAAATVLGVLNVAGALALAFAWMVLRFDPYDHNAPAAAAGVVLVAIAVAVLTAVLTGIAVLARWVGRRWFVGPALITVVGLILCYGGEAIQQSTVT